MLPGPAVPGSCLVSFHILWAILSTCTVIPTHLPTLNDSNNFVGYDDCARVCGRHSVSASPPEKVMIGFHNGSETFDFVRVDEDGAMVSSRRYFRPYYRGPLTTSIKLTSNSS